MDVFLTEGIRELFTEIMECFINLALHHWFFQTSLIKSYGVAKPDNETGAMFPQKGPTSHKATDRNI